MTALMGAVLFAREILPIPGSCRQRLGIPNYADLTKVNHMQIKVLVIDKVTETFDTKRGSKTLHLLVCQDQSRPPLRNSIDYEMTADEVSKYGASLVDKVVELNVRDMTQNFTGRIRMSGAILKVGA